MHNPKDVHFQAAYSVLRHLKSTPRKGILFKAYTDADWVGSVVDSAEAELRAMAHGICELLRLKIILDDLKIKWQGPMKLYCDNKSTINIAH
ncbi:hypothetical protein CK203_115959 [Vitis vinifera]|uniref:Retrovirus-related Pol polyprotein from transposon RE1 n=1 Tax=Vitis vinifera TaxID=29760 RepID=A0A438EIT2_VITVI|nr:hypothetical protein CK203_115959 [Vitis vinifera]